jgi:hypothetical protein
MPEAQREEGDKMTDPDSRAHKSCRASVTENIGC